MTVFIGPQWPDYSRWPAWMTDESPCPYCGGELIGNGVRGFMCGECRRTAIELIPRRAESNMKTRYSIRDNDEGTVIEIDGHPMQSSVVLTDAQIAKYLLSRAETAIACERTREAQWTMENGL